MRKTKACTEAAQRANTGRHSESDPKRAYSKVDVTLKGKHRALPHAVGTGLRTVLQPSYQFSAAGKHGQ